jgi:UDP-GlcNAc:undecaprenyl-phosphate GlcNAc-1-phosphate transferase
MVVGYLAAVLFLSQSFPGVAPRFVLIASLSCVVSALGFCDDRFNVRPLTRLAVEVLVGVAFAVGLCLIPPFGGGWVAGKGPVGLALFVPFVVLLVAGAINAVNMQDGLDGLAGGVALISCAGLAAAGVVLSQEVAAGLAFALGGALSAFLVYNFHPASVFMGDNGSYLVGFVVAAASLNLIVAKPTLAGVGGGVLLIGLPVFDALFAVIRRVGKGRSPFAGDRSHFYDLLAQRGFTVRQVAFINYSLQLLIVGAGLALLLK